MTFDDIRAKVMDRTNLSSADASARIGGFINERLRNVQTSCNLSRVRRGTITVTAPADATSVVLVDDTVDTTYCIKPITIFHGTRPLFERTHDQIKNTRVNLVAGTPSVYAVLRFGASDCEIELCPVSTDAVVLTVEGLLNGVDLAADDDVPAMPEDFHDVLVFGALADEYDHTDRADLAMKQEQKFEKRVRELRYFIQKSIYLQRVQGRMGSPSPFWWRVQ